MLKGKNIHCTPLLRVNIFKIKGGGGRGRGERGGEGKGKGKGEGEGKRGGGRERGVWGDGSVLRWFELRGDQRAALEQRKTVVKTTPAMTCLSLQPNSKTHHRD